MASKVVNVALQALPAGTSVGAYPVSSWQQGAGPPLAAAVTTTTVPASGEVTLSGLEADTRYVLAGTVGGVWRGVEFVTDPDDTEPLPVQALYLKRETDVGPQGTSAADISGLNGTFEADERPVRVSIGCYSVRNSVAPNGAILSVLVDVGDTGVFVPVLYVQTPLSRISQEFAGGASGWCDLGPYAEGTVVRVKAQVQAYPAGTVIVTAIAGGPLVLGVLRV